MKEQTEVALSVGEYIVYENGDKYHGVITEQYTNASGKLSYIVKTHPYSSPQDVSHSRVLKIVARKCSEWEFIRQGAEKRTSAAHTRTKSGKNYVMENYQYELDNYIAYVSKETSVEIHTKLANSFRNKKRHPNAFSDNNVALAAIHEEILKKLSK